MTIPTLTRGLERAGRQRTDIEVASPLFVVTGHDEAELAAAAVGTRKQIAFYASTPAYRGVLEVHGWGDLQTELHRLSREGDWDVMGSLIDDTMLDAFAVVAPIDEVAGKILDRCAGAIDRVLVGFPATVNEGEIAELTATLRRGAREERRDRRKGLRVSRFPPGRRFGRQQQRTPGLASVTACRCRQYSLSDITAAPGCARARCSTYRR